MSSKKVVGIFGFLATSIIAGFIGLFIGVIFEQPLQHKWDASLDRIWPTRKLDDADKERASMTEDGLQRAVLNYRTVLAGAVIGKGLQLRAQQSLSRAYSDLCVTRYWRGLFHLDYAKLAEDNAFIAEALDPKETETAIALAYAYACKEMGVSNKALTQSKVRELTADHLDNLEVQYLAWVVDPGGNASFVKKLEGERSPRLQHVLDVERAYAVKAASASDPKEKQDQLNRANEWLSKAQALYPGNPVVLFRRGYVSQLSQRMAEARDYYVRAIAGQTDFPRARDNLGTIYAHERAWNEAKSQFEAAAATQDAPVQARAASLRNLGAVYLELDPTIGFKSMCDVWQKANQLVVPEQTAEGSTHSALCDFPEDPKKACREYQAAVRLGDEHGWNLRQISTFREEWSVGPEEGKLLETLLGSCGV